MVRTRHAAVVLVAALVALVASGCGLGVGGSDGAAADEPGVGRVVRVVDGDTIVVELDGGEERVRLIGIDTPESKDPRSPVECFGPEATAHLEALLPEGTAVRLVRDVEARDRYDRLLAYVYRAGDGEHVNLARARDGFASVLTDPPTVAHAADFVAAVAEARAEQRGLWAACGGPDSPVG